MRNTKEVTNRLPCCSMYMWLPSPHGLYTACRTWAQLEDVHRQQVSDAKERKTRCNYECPAWQQPKHRRSWDTPHTSRTARSSPSRTSCSTVTCTQAIRVTHIVVEAPHSRWQTTRDHDCGAMPIPARDRAVTRRTQRSRAVHAGQTRAIDGALVERQSISIRWRPPAPRHRKSSQ